MIGYNPSHLNKNETLLEAFHRVEAYLKANPQYQVYQSSESYQSGKTEYTLGTIVVPEGSTVGKGDVVLFSNVYYAVITSVSETTFSVENATNFRGLQGPKGDPGISNANLFNTPGTSDTDGYTQKAVNGIVQNPNLLINPNFAINQRGQASYTASASTVYCVDRWYLYGSGTFDTSSKEVSLLTQYSSFMQAIENYKELLGKTVTFSISVSNVRGNALYMKVYGGQDIHITQDGIYTVTTTLPTSYTKFTCGLTRASNETGQASCVVNWAKLEIGSVATEFSPPTIAEELPKCLRYYEVIKNYGHSGRGYAIGGIKSASEARFYIEFKQTKRILPTITYSDASDFIIYNFVSAINCTSIATVAANEGGAMIRANGDSIGTIGAVCQLNSDGTKNGEIKIDAEL